MRMGVIINQPKAKQLGLVGQKILRLPQEAGASPAPEDTPTVLQLLKVSNPQRQLHILHTLLDNKV